MNLKELAVGWGGEAVEWRNPLFLSDKKKMGHTNTQKNEKSFFRTERPNATACLHSPCPARVGLVATASLVSIQAQTLCHNPQTCLDGKKGHAQAQKSPFCSTKKGTNDG
jgi:hypothetical protein